MKFKDHLAESKTDVTNFNRDVKKGEQITAWGKGILSKNMFKTIESLGFKQVSGSSIDAKTRRIIDDTTKVYEATKNIPKADMMKIKKAAFNVGMVRFVA